MASGYSRLSSLHQLWLLPCAGRFVFPFVFPSSRPRTVSAAPSVFPSSRVSACSPVPFSSRPTLDDVERLSRGKASKAKIGSRQVPHRLNTEERKAYELAKKKGYLVQRVWTRRYPLSNTFRNYCDALGWPCLRIDQGQSGSLDTVVIDLSTLRLDSTELTMVQTHIHESLQSKFGSLNNSIDSAETAAAQAMEIAPENHCIMNEQQLEEADQQAQDILTFHISRSEAQHLCQLVQDCCKNFASTIKKPLP